MGGAPVYRGMFRTIASVTPEKKAVVLYGSTEVEPVSVIFAEEKLQLEAEKPDGHCIGRPVFEDSARVIGILSEPPKEPVDISTLEMPRGEIGEIVVSGWHVNTHQVEEKRLVRDVEGRVWLRIEDAGYMDREGRLWLVGRVKWRVERNGKTFWSTVVEQKVLDRCSVVTFAAYLPHKEEAWLFIEAPRGLPASEESALKQFLLTEAIPVDHLVVKAHIPKDRRHQSKPNTAVLFAASPFKRYTKLAMYLLRSNPLLTLVLFLLFLIFGVIFLLVLS
ncbi:Olefin beta-lactone synthetase [Geodia barretti]|nr:Olefin beta-lactone synthetase [Geodia barretti]